VKVHFTDIGWTEYTEWQRTDADTAQKINDLIAEIRRQPFTGTGKPEPLKGNWSGWWSRRITKGDRIVYAISGKDDDQRVTIAKCGGHY
jgi:toxin YoeB